MPPEKRPKNLPIGVGAAFLSPSCELHAAAYNKLRSIAERGETTAILNDDGRVLHAGSVTEYAIPDDDLVDAVISTLRDAGLPPSLLTASACMSVGAALAVAMGLDRADFVETSGQIYDHAREEKEKRTIAARAANPGAN